VERSITSDVILYHDETTVAGHKGHGLFFVPVKTRVLDTGGLFGTESIEMEPQRLLFEKLRKIRREFSTDHKLHFSKISGSRWTSRNEAEIKSVRIGVGSLRERGTRSPMFCKLGIIFYESPRQEQIACYGGEVREEKLFRYDETVLRMLLKGAVHYLYDYNHKVRILGMVSDGQPCHRRLDEFRILNRLQYEVRDYVDFHRDAEIVHLSSNHRDHAQGSKEYMHANMLQLTDMLLGGVIYACFNDVRASNPYPRTGCKVENKKAIIAYPVRKLLDKRKRGGGFRNSGHYKSFTVSKAFIRNGEWQFDAIETRDKIASDSRQMALIDK